MEGRKDKTVISENQRISLEILWFFLWEKFIFTGYHNRVRQRVADCPAEHYNERDKLYSKQKETGRQIWNRNTAY